MPAQSKQQLNLMKLVRGVQTGNTPKSKVDAKVKKMAKDMDPEDVKDFAKTPESGLPDKKKQESVKESAPEGWEKTVKGMKKHKDIDNPWALAHWMKGKGYQSKKEQAQPHSGQEDLENNPAVYKNAPIAEAEDCGCNKSEQSIHTSNKLSLKTAMNGIKAK